jgi:hypothetical protein
LEDEPSISNYLFDRRATTIARIKLPDGVEGSDEINKWIEFYDNMTAFFWPSRWKTLVAAIVVCVLLR